MVDWIEWPVVWAGVVTAVLIAVGTWVLRWRPKVLRLGRSVWKALCWCTRNILLRPWCWLRNYPTVFINKRVDPDKWMKANEGFRKYDEWEDEQRWLWVRPMFITRQGWVLQIVTAPDYLEESCAQITGRGWLCRNPDHRDSRAFVQKGDNADNANPMFRIPLTLLDHEHPYIDNPLPGRGQLPLEPRICNESGDTH